MSACNNDSFRKGIEHVAINLIKKRIDRNHISEVTGISRNDIEELANYYDPEGPKFIVENREDKPLWDEFIDKLVKGKLWNEFQDIVMKISTHNMDRTFETIIDRVNTNIELTCRAGLNEFFDKCRWVVGSRALYLAAARSNIELCKILIPIMTDDDLNAIHRDNAETVLHRAAFRGMKEVCELLISRMSDEAINHIDESGETALFGAAGWCMTDICELLINRMSDEAVNALNDDDYTVLYIAINNVHRLKDMAKICRLLIPRLSRELVEDYGYIHRLINDAFIYCDPKDGIYDMLVAKNEEINGKEEKGDGKEN